MILAYDIRVPKKEKRAILRINKKKKKRKNITLGQVDNGPAVGKYALCGRLSPRPPFELFVNINPGKN